MAKIVVGPINQGLRNDVTPFNVDNDSFPTLINAYQWRGRIKRKRGTELFGRLTRNLYTQSLGTTSGAGTFSVNIFTQLSLPTTASLVLESLIVSDGTNTLTDNGDGTLTGAPGGTGTINYASGLLTLTGAALTAAVTATFAYYPGLPVLGLEPFVGDPTDNPAAVGFDTTYAYNLGLTHPYEIHSVSFYNNPPTGAYAGYTQKTTWTPLIWNLADYQQIWTTNYQGAMWAVPGIRSPFDATKIGMQFKAIVTVTVASATTATLQITGHGLVVGDFVFVNEVATTTGINFETGFVTTVTDVNNVIVTFPSATLATNGTGGIAQYLTNNSDTTKDCIRWYNGDPVNDPDAGTFTTNRGWVNFCPPLTTGDVGTFSIADLPPAKYYLVGARMAVPFKDRLIFFGAVVQSSTTGPFYLQDTIVYSQNGTPYYTTSFPYATVNPSPSIIPTTSFTPILLPTNQTAQPSSWWENATGFGGFLSAGYARPITSVSINEDALIVGLADRQTRLLYSGNDIVPFNFYVINSELGSDSTFSTITLDRGVLSVGGRGIILTSQTASQRVDLQIPDQVFQIKLTDAGSRRVCAQRDFINEWIYFSYPANQFESAFPTETLQYNYRDDSWAMFRESYTTYGTIRRVTGQTWNTLADSLTWNNWSTPWDSGISELLQPLVIGGNAQGFIMIRTGTTEEGKSLYIQDFGASSVVTSPDHCLNNDYIIISDALGAIGDEVNNNIYLATRIDDDTFRVSPSFTDADYLGGGLITRMYVPYVQTKQFPAAWDMSRKTRLGNQQYLLTTTNNAQITLLIFLSQDSSNPYNIGPIVPTPGGDNNTLVYSTVLYTCPESTNLGLTPANTNLQMPTAQSQSQIWHRINTSLLGDTVQLGFTLSDEQMRSPLIVEDEAITGATQANPCVLTCAGQFPVNTAIYIDGVVGMTELNENTYMVTDFTASTVTINVDSRGFTSYASGGTATQVTQRNQFAEIELHGIIIDVTPSSVLA
jgi:hypothetical protein